MQKRKKLQDFWMTKLQKNCQKINSNIGDLKQAETFITQNIKWVFAEIGAECAIECLRKTKTYEP